MRAHIDKNTVTFMTKTMETTPRNGVGSFEPVSQK